MICWREWTALQIFSTSENINNNNRKNQLVESSVGCSMRSIRAALLHYAKEQIESDTADCRLLLMAAIGFDRFVGGLNKYKHSK